MTSATTSELEFKFDAEPTTPLPSLPDVDVRDERRVRLTAVYWDTPHCSLLARGATLRHRRADDGSEDGWALKLPEPPTAEAATRREVKMAGPGEQPPITLRNLITPMVLHDDVVPVAVITTDRRLNRATSSSSGVPVVEIADDRVESTVEGRSSSSFRQIEVVLLDPTAKKQWKQIKRKLLREGLTPSDDPSKLQHVLGRPPTEFHRHISEDATVSQFLSAVIGASVGQLIEHDPWVRLEVEPEAVHKARVATRRLRADLKTYRSLLDEPTIAAVRNELKWLGGLLGDVRDNQVLTAKVEDQTRTLNGSPGELVDYLTHQGVVARGALLTALQTERYIDLLETLRDLTADPPLRDPNGTTKRARPRARKLAARKWSRARRHQRRLGTSPTDEDLHALRKAVKQAGYAAESTRQLGLGSKAFIRSTRHLQAHLGDLHDVVVELAWLNDHVDDVGTRGAFLAGQLTATAARRRTELRSTWKHLWKAATAERRNDSAGR